MVSGFWILGCRAQLDLGLRVKGLGRAWVVGLRL